MLGGPGSVEEEIYESRSTNITNVNRLKTSGTVSAASGEHMVQRRNRAQIQENGASHSPVCKMWSHPDLFFPLFLMVTTAKKPSSRAGKRWDRRRRRRRDDLSGVCLALRCVEKQQHNRCL